MSTNETQSRLRDDKTVNTYDLLKALAVVLMVVDHVGVYFYPDEVWFRVLGRLCVPIWFFLIGYAHTQEIPRLMWLGAILIALSAPLSGQYFLPLSILVTMMLARHWRAGFARRTFHNAETLRGMFLILSLAALPTATAVEYGSLGFLFVMIGVMSRHWDEISARIKPRYLILFVAGSFAVFWGMQGGLSPKINLEQSIVLVFGLLAVALILMRFRPAALPRVTWWLSPVGAYIIRLLGRRSLEIYIFHIMAFRLAAPVFDSVRFPFYEIKMIAPGLIAPML